MAEDICDVRVLLDRAFEHQFAATALRLPYYTVCVRYPDRDAAIVQPVIDRLDNMSA